MRVLVCGGRDYSDLGFVFQVLDSLHMSRPIAVLIHGAARGADSLADLWAKTRGVTIEAYPADWKSSPKGAGPIRNQIMLDQGHPDLCVAFPGGSGTYDMISKCRKVGVKVVAYRV